MELMVLISNDQEEIPVNQEFLELLETGARQCLVHEGFVRGELSIALLDERAMQDLNYRYRGKDEPTDVLSFPQGEDDLLGDVLLSLPRAQEQAVRFGHSLERETVYLLIHGILHLLGYEHGVDADKMRMRKTEEEILEKLGLSRSGNGEV